MPISRCRAHTALVLSATLVLLSCGTQSRTVEAPFEAPNTFTRSGDRQMPERWWRSFEDDSLNKAVRLALADNFNLLTAWERLRAARALVDREASSLLPDLEGSAAGGISRTSSSSAGLDDIQLGLSSVYEVDLWGRIRSRVEAEEYRADGTFADYQTAAITLAAEVVRTWYRLAEAQAQLALVEAQIGTNVEMLNLIENRFAAGLVPSVDLLRQRQLVEATREQYTLADARAETLRHQLAVLLGRPPQNEVAAVPDALPQLPPLPETGVPLELIRRRPDVRSAFLTVRAADRDLASAIANQYPRLSLTASAVDNSAQNLFQNWVTSLGGSLFAPVFYGGELRAEVDRTEAVKRQQLAQYGQTVLIAFQEVEDALALESRQLEAIESAEAQVGLAEQAYQQLRIQYFNGTTDYLDVLTALTEVQELHRDLLTARLNLVEYRIALYRALAGSFETGREEIP